MNRVCGGDAVLRNKFVSQFDPNLLAIKWQMECFRAASTRRHIYAAWSYKLLQIEIEAPLNQFDFRTSSDSTGIYYFGIHWILFWSFSTFSASLCVWMKWGLDSTTGADSRRKHILPIRAYTHFSIIFMIIYFGVFARNSFYELDPTPFMSWITRCVGCRVAPEEP